MNVYIPIIGILMFLHVYLMVGITLAVPLALWQNRFISGKPKGKGAIKVIRAFVITSIAWPIILGYNIKTEIDYRKKGYL